MNVEKRTVFYELLIRGNFGAEHQRGMSQNDELGAFVGCHYREIELLVDVDTGEIIGEPKLLPAQPLTRDRIEQYFGAQVATFMAAGQEAEIQFKSQIGDLQTRISRAADESVAVAARKRV